MLLSAFYITLGLLFGGWVWWAIGPQSGKEYLTGFVIEKSLSMDNVFVIAMIFGFFAIPRRPSTGCCSGDPRGHRAARDHDRRRRGPGSAGWLDSVALRGVPDRHRRQDDLGRRQGL
jgi:hypothetical protein